MDSPLNKIWKERPDIIRLYYDALPNYERLCGEVKYILEKEVKNAGIEIGHLNSRAKALGSFCEKIERKSYKNPFNEITDLAGVRLVFLYSSDKKRLEKIVEENFEIHDKVDKISDQGVEKFGYGALHYVVSLKEQHAGARYDDIRNVLCEIQIRTILQDAWAIVAHHLSYKHEDDIPNELKRKLHALSGLFETADDQFERINYARTEYQNKIKVSISANSSFLLEEDINLDNLIAYMSWKFPNRDTSHKEAAADLLDELNKFGYRKLKNIDDAVNRAIDAVLASEKKYPPQDRDDDCPTQYVGVGLIRGVLEFIDEEYRKNRGVVTLSRVAEFSKMVK